MYSFYFAQVVTEKVQKIANSIGDYQNENWCIDIYLKRSKTLVHSNANVQGCSSNISSSYFFRQSKVRSMLHHGSVGASSEKNKRNLTLNLTLTLNFLLPTIDFLIKFVSIMVFKALSFLRLIHSLFLTRGGNVS